MKNRLIQLAKTIWPFLTNDEKEAYYCDCGTIGFIEDLCHLIHATQEDIDTLTEVDVNDILYYLNS